MPTKIQGLLQPLPIPEQVWEDISMDFITHLPTSAGHSVIWVICDRLTKYAHFLTLPTHFTAQQLASRFSVEICQLHGLPKTIISDRDPLFVNTFWQHMFKAQGTTLKFSSSYHPQTDGQTEVLNRGLEAYLRCFVGNQPNKWHQFLHLAELWHNTTYHSAIGTSPFRALYGRQPPTAIDFLRTPQEGTTIPSALADHFAVLQEIKEHLRHTRQRMCDQANQHRTDRSFEPGNWVWVCLQPYRQRTLERRTHQKLGPRFSGPYKVLRRIGAVVYELQLPPTTRVHPVFHVSLLRPFKGTTGETPSVSTISTSNCQTTLNSISKSSQKLLNAPPKEPTSNKTRVPLTKVVEPHGHEPLTHVPTPPFTATLIHKLYTPLGSTSRGTTRVSDRSAAPAFSDLEPNANKVFLKPTHPNPNAVAAHSANPSLTATPPHQPAIQAQLPHAHPKGTNAPAAPTTNPSVVTAPPSQSYTQAHLRLTRSNTSPYSSEPTSQLKAQHQFTPPAKFPISPPNAQDTAQQTPRLHFEDKVPPEADSNVSTRNYTSRRPKKQPNWMQDFILG